MEFKQQPRPKISRPRFKLVYNRFVMTGLQTIAENLLRVRAQPMEVPGEPGVYAVIIVDPDRLPGIEVDMSGLLFIGMAKSNLRRQIRFMHRQSGFSTLRRSLGAILKDQLGLRAIPLESGASDTYLNHYQFADETPLDVWMRSHLAYGYNIITRHIRTIDRSLIRYLRPPLNLAGWPNTQAEKLKTLRDICKNEAYKREIRSRQLDFSGCPRSKI